MPDGGQETKDSATSAAELGSEPTPDVSVRLGVEEKILHDETDGRKRHHWTSAYPKSARTEIRCETAFVVLVLATALLGIYLTWYGAVGNWLSCPTCSQVTLRRYAYFFFSGMLGSVLFGGKYLYHVVARGYWHQDRRLWRVLSPFLSASLAVVVAAAIDSGILGIAFRAGSHAACVAMGFFSGYFADKALAKMSEIADVVFGVRDVGRKPRENEKNG